MSVQSASIIFADSSSRCNKDLTDYLQRNIEFAIRRGGLSFNFKIAKPSDTSNLRQRGIKRLPAMIIANTPYIGTPNIIHEIQNRIRTNKNIAAEKTDEETIRDYHTQVLGNIVKNADGKLEVKDNDNDDNSDTLPAQLQSKFNEEIQRRGISTTSSNDTQKTQPSRQSTRDVGNTTYNRGNQRPNNVASVDDADPMAEAFESLKRVSKNAAGEEAQDDALMGTLLARMGME
jgi:hypothetical protein